jgi:APA family basic amino acid/polyamine antiporter
VIPVRVAAHPALPSAPRPVPAYRRVLVPVSGHDSEAAVAIACELAAEHGAAVTAVEVVEIPAELPLNALMPDEEQQARRARAETQAVGDLYGITVTVRIVRARSAGPAIVEQAEATRAELIVLRAPRKQRASKRGAIFGGTASHVLTHAPCRVMVVTAPRRT